MWNTCAGGRTHALNRGGLECVLWLCVYTYMHVQMYLPIYTLWYSASTTTIYCVAFVLVSGWTTTTRTFGIRVSFQIDCFASSAAFQPLQQPQSDRSSRSIVCRVWPCALRAVAVRVQAMWWARQCCGHACRPVGRVSVVRRTN